MIVMEYMGNGVLDSFLRVSAVVTAGVCHLLGLCWRCPLELGITHRGFSSSFFTEK